ncbi:unnamed protein product [Allacma fusca]|uniref:SH3 and cysteine-rich domain-containing protein 3 n=1 Tax=Allacma fusca TaxID=39272 RepID=A0A8J2J5Q7_9HEXA|nr:unnamed protein product [Allacma fusca]
MRAICIVSQTYRDYCDACMAHVQQGTSTTMANYLDAHNAYVLQLRGTNAMLKEYHQETLPQLLQELDEIYIDLCNNLSDSILHGADLVSSRMQETNRRYETLANVCRNVSGTQDLRDLVKSMTVPAAPNQRHAFTQPVPLIPPADGVQIPLVDKSHVPVLKDELLVERLTTPGARNRQETLRKEMSELESEMKQLNDSLDTLIRMQQRSLDSNLFNKANELQEEISMKRFDLRVAQMHLAALKAQTRTETSWKEDQVDGKSGLVGGVSGPVTASSAQSQQEKEKFIRERKMSVSSNATMKSKWMKAFRTLKGPTPGPSSPSKEPEKKNGKEKDKQASGEAFQIFENHIFQEYTYKKITPCDICSQVLRGHTKQGLRCRLCKLNVHTDCQGKVSKCLPKTRLLRRQRSTSELETRLNQITNEQAPPEDEPSTKTGQIGDRGEPRPDEPDLIYQVLKQATDIKKTGGSSSGSGSGNGIHGSSQTLYSQHDVGAGGVPNVTMASAAARRSNPSVNVVGQSGGLASGATTPGGAAQALASQSSSSAPHSPRRRKLDLRMKSFSLDSPESTEHAQRRRYAHGSQSTSHSQYSTEDGMNEESSSQPPNLRHHHYKYGMVHSKSANVNPTHSSSVVSLKRASSPPSSLLTTSALSDSLYTTNQTNATIHDYSQLQSPSFASLNHFAPSSPVHNRRALLSTRNVRMSSVELPDENDKSLSSASTSPCPSPKPHRLLPTNLYVVLYMFKARHPDELDLKAGYKVTVTDTTDPDWWQGKCLGRMGYFPSKYVTKLQPGEKPLQVTHNLQVTDGAENGLKLLRDQIVIQVGEELDGMVTIRNGDNKQGICPLKYLQEV